MRAGATTAWRGACGRTVLMRYPTSGVRVRATETLCLLPRGQLLVQTTEGTSLVRVLAGQEAMEARQWPSGGSIAGLPSVMRRARSALLPPHGRSSCGSCAGRQSSTCRHVRWRRPSAGRLRARFASALSRPPLAKVQHRRCGAEITRALSLSRPDELATRPWASDASPQCCTLPCLDTAPYCQSDRMSAKVIACLPK